LLEKTLHDEKIYTFSMPNYTKYSHYKEEGKPLLDNASLANKQSKNVYQMYLDHQVETSLQIQNLQKEKQEIEESMRKELDGQRQEDESIIEKLRDEIENLKHDVIFNGVNECANRTPTSEITPVTTQISPSPSQTTHLQLQTATTNAQNNTQLNEVISNKNRILITPQFQEFKGDGSSSVTNWLYTVNRTMERQGIIGDQIVDIASSLLKDIAQAEYNLHEISNGVPTWEKFQEFKMERFTPSNQSDLIRDSMKSLKQTHDVKGYYIEFKRLAVQLSDMTEKDKCKAIINGLRPGTAAWVRFAQKNTLDEAYTYAVHVETHRMHELNVPNAQNESTTISNLAISENQSSFNRKGPIYSSFRNKQPLKTCNYCNKAGHNALECRYRIAYVNQQKTRKMPNSSQVTCIICSRTGNIAENCYYNKPKPSYMTKLSNSKSSLDIIAWHAHIDGSKVLAALDSASHLSIMSQATANKLGIRHYPTSRAIKTSTGDKTTAIGTTGQIQVEFEGTIASIAFTVTDLEAYDILLGLDWFDQTGVLLDPKNQSFIIPQRVVKISTKNRDSESIINEDEIEEIATSLNSMNIEAEAGIRDDFELCDDYTCFNEKSTIEMKPAISIQR
jgi:hypothetical protein